MKSLVLTLALCLSVCFADLPGQLHTSHYSQHHQTVEDAKHQVNQRLGGQFGSNDGDRQFHQSSFEEVDSYGVGTLSSSHGLGVGVASNLGSLTGSLSSSYGSQQLNSRSPHYVAGSVGGRESSRSSQYVHSQSSTSPVVIPVASGGVESFSEHEEQHVENSGSPIGVAVIGSVGGAESYANHNMQHRTQSQFTPIYTAPSGTSESYVHHKEQHVESKTSPVFVAPSSGSEKYTQQHQRRVQNQITPLYVSQPRGSESYTQHEEHVVQNQAVPLVVSPSRSSESFSHHRQQRVQAQTSPIVTSPIGGSESYSHQRQQHIQSQTVPLVAAPASESESYTHRREERIEQRPVSLHYTPSTGSESYAQMSKFSSMHPTPVVIQPYHGNSYNTHSQHYEHQTSGNQMPAVVYSAPSTNSHSAYSDLHSSNRVSSSLVPIVTGGASSNSLLSENLSASATGAVVFPSIKTDSKFGHLGVGLSGSSSDLNRYMSESERLARTQAQGIGSSGIRTGSAQVDSSFDLSGGQSNVLSGVPVGNAGYRSKSWEKNSKWSSETQYGSDGRTKNYNHISTGESEQVDINGKRDGYKAATTTLDDDGKVSTYSIHT